jgi:chemotaxis protein MotA
MMAHLQGYAPAVSIEFARKVLLSHIRPTFIELEEATQELSSV